MPNRENPALSFEDQLNIKELNGLISAHDITGRHVAALLDVTEVTVSRWRHGKRRVTYDTLQTLREMLEGGHAQAH